MPRINIGAGDFSGVKAAQGFSNYDGPTPPKGVYRCKTGLFRLVINNSGDYMFKIIFEINEPQGSEKSKYNGYAIWHNANLTEKSAPFTNALLDALKIDRKAVWNGENGGIVTLKDKPEDVKTIGGKRVKDIDVLVTTSRVNYPVGSDQWKLEGKTFVAGDAARQEDPDEGGFVDDDDAAQGGPVGQPDTDDADPDVDDGDDDAF